MPNNVSVSLDNRYLYFSPSTDYKIHDLTMLFLKDKTFESTKDLAKQYIDISKALNLEITEYRKSSK